MDSISSELLVQSSQLSNGNLLFIYFSLSKNLFLQAWSLGNSSPHVWLSLFTIQHPPPLFRWDICKISYLLRPFNMLQTALIVYILSFLQSHWQLEILHTHDLYLYLFVILEIEPYSKLLLFFSNLTYASELFSCTSRPTTDDLLSQCNSLEEDILPTKFVSLLSSI